MQKLSYVLITPAKNEAAYIEKTIRSVMKQSHLPLRWIIVNDGSTDKTRDVCDRFARQCDWLTVIDNTDSEQRSAGEQIVRAFYCGYNALSIKEYDFLGKLDADVSLPVHYFEKVAEGFAGDPRVGICGGYCVIDRNGKKIKERSHAKFVRGAIKAYRRECFEEIGGLKPIMGWDGLDQYTARYYGWNLKVLPIAVTLHRKTGITEHYLRLNFKRGVASYQSGHDIFVATLGALSRSLDRPILAGPVFLSGYLFAFLSRKKKLVDKDLEKFIRKTQYKRIFFPFKKLRP